MENEKIIQLLRTGQNGEALKNLYQVFPSVNHFVKANGGNEDDARDMFQESLLVFYKNVQKDDFTLTCSINTYLFSIVKYLWKDELKKKNRMVNFEIKEPVQEAQTYLEEESKMTMIDKMLDQLGDRCKQILQLFYYKKKSMEEIAQLLNYRNVDTAKTQKYKCMERAKLMANDLMLSSLNEEL